MKGKIVINYEDHQVNIESDLEGQELYEAYVGLTGYIAGRVKDIRFVANTAVNDALRLIIEKANN